MKFLFKIILIVIFIIGTSESGATTLFDSLNSAFLNNHKLNAERANMRATKEENELQSVNFCQQLQFLGT